MGYFSGEHFSYRDVKVKGEQPDHRHDPENSSLITASIHNFFQSWGKSFIKLSTSKTVLIKEIHELG